MSPNCPFYQTLHLPAETEEKQLHLFALSIANDLRQKLLLRFVLGFIFVLFFFTNGFIHLKCGTLKTPRNKQEKSLGAAVRAREPPHPASPLFSFHSQELQSGEVIRRGHLWRSDTEEAERQEKARPRSSERGGRSQCRFN